MFVCLIILPLSRVLKLLIHDFINLLISGCLVLLGVWISQIVGEGKICNFILNQMLYLVCFGGKFIYNFILF